MNQRPPLTDEETLACESAAQYPNVTPMMLWGAKGDAILAARIARTNLVRYRQLHHEWLVEIGQERPPEDHWDK